MQIAEQINELLDSPPNVEQQKSTRARVCKCLGNVPEKRRREPSNWE